MEIFLPAKTAKLSGCRVRRFEERWSAAIAAEKHGGSAPLDRQRLLREGEGFDEDQPGQLLADGEAGVADLADDVIAAGDEADDLVFAKADLAQAVLDIRRGAELFHAHRDAGLDAAQRTNFTAGFLCHTGCCRMHAHGKSFAQAAGIN